MAYVDQDFVAQRLAALLPERGLTFTAVPPDDDSVDGEVAVALHGTPVDFAVQVGAGYVGLNQYFYSGTGASRQMTAAQHHGMWGVQPADLRLLATRLAGLVGA